MCATKIKIIQKEVYMYNVVENFLANPCEDTFKPIQGNCHLLLKTFREDEDLAKKFFDLEDWRLINNEATDLEIREIAFVRHAIAFYNPK